jgi:hypothetical protein
MAKPNKENCASYSDSIESGHSSKVLMTKNFEKIQLQKRVFFDDKKIAIYLSLGLRKGRPAYWRNLLKREHPALKKSFFFFCIFALLDPDPDPQH